MAINLDYLKRKLTTQERVIQELFSLMPACSDIIKEKLSEFQESIASIPIYFDEQFYLAWSEKMAQLWGRYAVKMGNLGLVHSIEISNEEPKALMVNIEHQENIAPQVSTSQDMNQSTASSESESHESIRSKIENQFAQLQNEVHTEEDLDKLMKTINHVRALILPLWRDVCLQENMFELAFAKLPPVCRTAYKLEQGQQTKSLGKLYQFLSNPFNRLLLDFSSENDLSNEKAPSAIDSIRSQMKREFDQLTPVESNSDGNALRKLYGAVSKARRLTLPFHREVWLLKEMFDLAFPKLPEEGRLAFGRLNNPKRKSLYDLFLFLTDQLCGRELNSSKQIISQIEHNICSLSRVESATDVKALRQLIIAITDSMNLFSLEINCDYLFYRRIFHCAFLRLSQQLRQQYCESTHTNCSLFDFRKFLADLLATNCHSIRVCIECSQSGHLSTHCPIRKCRICLHIGHRTDQCHH